MNLVELCNILKPRSKDYGKRYITPDKYEYKKDYEKSRLKHAYTKEELKLRENLTIEERKELNRSNYKGK